MPDADGEELKAVLESYARSRLLMEAVRLGVVERLSTDRAVPVRPLAAELGLDPEMLRRFLRALATLGVVELRPDLLTGDAAALTGAGGLLRRDHPRSLAPVADFCAEHGWPAWSTLGTALADGDRLSADSPDNPFAVFADDRVALDRFEAQMVRAAERYAGAIAAALDLPPGTSVLDVGGGSGPVAAALLAREPKLEVTVLDRPYAEPGLRRYLGARCPDGGWDFVAGDFFQAVPAGHDLHLLSRVLHDWGDRDADRILARCAAAARPGSRLAVFEKTLPAGGAADPGALADFALSDLNTWLMCGGRERSREELAALVGRHGYRVLDQLTIDPRHVLLVAEHPGRDA
ncbi:MAG: hypothetical protein AVDCRST_MAG41-3884 [uncultured Corynebacteriales bacterium]|uniref:Uncharacterized protein n=1 Tax=uncultured Mycobacteriales bacterium TaxID=581187 RepID=A0A6J4JQ70_9ACTN|nr:MAG: hypothetical protein AVDCRST_MAG41-3884 [uncultured Corynebacteriales bacterium]